MKGIPNLSFSRIYRRSFWAVLVFSSLGFFQDFFWLALLAAQFSFYTTIFLLFYALLGAKIVGLRFGGWSFLLFVFHAILLIRVHTQLPWKAPNEELREGMELLVWNKNVGSRNDAQARIFLDSSQVFWQGILEVSPSFAKALPQRFRKKVRASEGYFGLALLHLGEDTVQEFRLLNGTISVYRSRIMFGASPIQIYLVHLLSPLKPWEYQQYLQCFREFDSLLGRDPCPKIVLGDFNSTIYSHRFRSLLRTHELQKLGRPLRNTPTYGLGMPMLELDHILVSESLERAMCYRRESFHGSDHTPLRLQIQGSD